MADKESVSKLKLLSSHHEAGNVRTFVFETGGIKWIPGQCQCYVLPQAGTKEEDNLRYFTIASSPSEGEIHISTRVSQSRFKQALNAMKVGDEILAHGVEGDFTWEEESTEGVVLVAGGIGITPYRSILLARENHGKPLNAKLLYFNRDVDAAFETVLKALEAMHPELSVLMLIGEQISAEAILQHAPQASKQTLYLSGPESMVESVGSDLKKRGVNVKQDWFPGYDDKNY